MQSQYDPSAEKKGPGLIATVTPHSAPPAMPNQPSGFSKLKNNFKNFIPSSTDNRILWVDTARCFAMFFIMWLHIREAPSWLPTPVGGGICFFFMTAGYFMPRKPFECAMRTAQMAMAWLIWSMLSALLFLMGSGVEGMSWQRVIGWDAAAFNTPLWFLRNLVVYQCIFLALMAARILPWGSALVLIICLIWPYDKAGEHHIALRFDWMTAMMLGFVLANIPLTVINHHYFKSMSIIALTSIGLICLEVFGGGLLEMTLLAYSIWPMDHALSFALEDLPLLSFGIAFGYLFLAMLVGRWFPIGASFFSVAGKNMMFIYAAHSILYALIVGIEQHYFGSAVYDGIWMPILAMVLLTMASQFLCRLSPTTMVLLGSLSSRHFLGIFKK